MGYQDAAHGVPALAGRVCPVKPARQNCEIQNEAGFDRLKPGLHA